MNKILLLVAFSVLSVATMAGTAFASSVAQRFTASDAGIVGGALVSLKEKSGDSVTLATLANRSRLVGVAGKEASIELGSGNSLGVVLSGTAATLVSDFNGDVKSGDRITASPIDGIGMKATENVMVVGTAQSDMDVSNTEERTINGGGKTRTVKIGAVPLMVSPAFYAAQSGESATPSQLQLFANNLVGHNVSIVRILAAVIVVVMLLGAVVMLIYTSVKSSITAIGRNPLSKSTVYTSLFEVGIATLGISAFAVIIVYLILTS